MKIIIKYTPSILFRIAVIATFLLFLVGIIGYARGYRFNLQENRLVSTGIISVSSQPKAAKIYINGELQGATDTNLTLPYGRYTIDVKKEGYSDWKKTIALKGETVMSLDAKLFSKNPTLTPLTNISISKAIALRGSDTIVVVSQSGNEETDGIYLFDASRTTLSLFPQLTPLVMKSLFPKDIDLNSLSIQTDPELQQAVVSFGPEDTTQSYLISLDQINSQLLQLANSKEKNIISQWQIQQNKEAVQILQSLPAPMVPVALKSFLFVEYAPNKKKLLYVAKSDDTLPYVISPPLIGSNQTPEQRTISKGSVYIYDIKEDKNYLQPAKIDPREIDVELSTRLSPPEEADLESTQSAHAQPLVIASSDTINAHVFSQMVWYPTSDYIVFKDYSQIKLIQYDGENAQTVYAGPFDQSFFTISKSGNLIVNVDLNPNDTQFGDLYSVSLQ